MLYDKLKNNKRLPFHMPGHKRNIKLLGNKFPYDIDITEIDGFDNLHSPDSIIKEIEDKAKEKYECDNSFILVNGSTVGILAGILATVKQGNTVLIARNCHKSVYNGIELAGAKAEYILPEVDEYGILKAVEPDALEDKIRLFNPKLVVITSPTYEGVNSDIEKLSEITHKYNIPLMLDAAHGAHYVGYAKYADITVMSLHKTMPALTQCALAHVNGHLVNPEEYRIKLSMLETSSPSYILMSSVEECLDIKLDYRTFNNKRYLLFVECKKLSHLKLIDYDISKLVVFCGYSNISGVKLAEKLRNEYSIEAEMAAKNYVVLILTACDDFKNYKLLKNALFQIDNNLKSEEYISDKLPQLPQKSTKKIENKKLLNFDAASGNVCAEYIWAYPPGIPIIVPGEIISEEILSYINDSLKSGVNIQSTYSSLPEKIYCQL